MREAFVVEAEVRTTRGKGASRRLRHEGKIPAIIYGGKGQPQSITVNHNELSKHLKIEAFYSHILTISIGGVTEQAVLKDLHRHPVRDEIMHMDLQRVLADQLLRMHVPLHFKGAEIAPGIKTGGGIIEHHLIQVEVECLPKDLPEFLEVDLSALNVNEAVHLPRAAVEPEPVAVEAAAAEVPATAQKVEAKPGEGGDAKKDDKKK